MNTHQEYVLNWPLLKRKIVSMYKQGLSLRAIASEMGASHTTINKWLCRWGVQRRVIGNRRGPLIDLTGTRSGHLAILRKHEGEYPTRWTCRCDCGKVVSVSSTKLL